MDRRKNFDDRSGRWSDDFFPEERRNRWGRSDDRRSNDVDRYWSRDRDFGRDNDYGHDEIPSWDERSSSHPNGERDTRTRGGIYGVDDGRMEFGARERYRDLGARGDSGFRAQGFERSGYDRSAELARRNSGPASHRRGNPSDHEEGIFESVMNFFGIGPKGYRRSDDRIYEEVCEALARHPAVDARDIEVSVKEGVVSLTGTVPSRRVKRLAEECVEDLTGVVDVHNSLRLTTESSSSTSKTASTGQSTIATDTAKAPLRDRGTPLQ